MNDESPISNLAERSPIMNWLRRLCSWRVLRRALIALACVITLIALIYAEENWRGKHAWDAFRREWEAKGEQFDFAAFAPKPVPPEQNFCATPFLAPLFEFDRTGPAGEVRLKDTNAIARIHQLNLYALQRPNLPNPGFGSVEKQELTDLKTWQDFFRSNTNFSSPPQPVEPSHDVLFALSDFNSVVNELQAANRRPYAVIPARFEDSTEIFPTLVAFRTLSQFLRLRMAANLEANHAEDALLDIQLSFRLADVLKSQPLLLSHLVRIAIVRMTLDAVWEGQAREAWGEAEYQELEKTLAAQDLLADYLRAMRGERAFSNDLIDKMRRGKFPGQMNQSDDTGFPAMKRLAFWAPSGLLYQNQRRINRLHQELTLQAVDAATHRVYPDRCRGMDDLPELRRATPYNVLARMLFPAFAKSVMNTAHAQALIDLARVSNALERFRVSHGEYPEKLEALVPQFLSQLPSDLINGQSLKYRRSADGYRDVYSVGWNESDDDGILLFRPGKTPMPDHERGDWVWRLVGR